MKHFFCINLNQHKLGTQGSICVALAIWAPLRFIPIGIPSNYISQIQQTQFNVNLFHFGIVCVWIRCRTWKPYVFIKIVRWFVMPSIWWFVFDLAGIQFKMFGRSADYINLIQVNISTYAWKHAVIPHSPPKSKHYSGVTLRAPFQMPGWTWKCLNSIYMGFSIVNSVSQFAGLNLLSAIYPAAKSHTQVWCVCVCVFGRPKSQWNSIGTLMRRCVFPLIEWRCLIAK